MRHYKAIARRSRNRLELPSLAKEGCLRPSRKCGAASLAGADGVVGSSHRLSVVEPTTPAAPSKEGGHFLDGAAFSYASPCRARASRPPWPRRGVWLAQESRQKKRNAQDSLLLRGRYHRLELPLLIRRVARVVVVFDRLRSNQLLVLV